MRNGSSNVPCGYVIVSNNWHDTNYLTRIDAQGKVKWEKTFDISKVVHTVNELTATIAQQPELIGQLAVKAAKDVLQGKKVDKSIPAPLKLVTK
ncbi:D-ribose-binding periplasmic protein precursor [compost metagenome]